MLLLIFFSLFFVIVLYHAIGFIVRQLRLRYYLSKIPGPPGLPLIGNIMDFLVTPDELWKTVRKMNDDYYPIYKIWSSIYAIINIRHPDDVEILLSSQKNITKGMVYDFLFDWFGTGLLTSTGRKWQHRRKILTPAFHFNVLREFSEIFNEEGHRMVTDLQRKQGPVTVDLLSFVTKYTLNAICETAMGTSLSGMESTRDNFQKTYRNAVHRLGGVMLHRLLRPWLHFKWIFSLTPTKRMQSKDLAIVRGFSKKIIGERKNYHKDTNGIHLRQLEQDNLKSFNRYGSKKKLAMLDLLIVAMKHGHIDDDGIWEEVDTFMFEGHDTTAMGIVFALLMLAEHTTIQERVRAEVDEAMSKNDGQLGIGDLQQLPYLERCIKESLRLYPSVPFISRTISEDIKLRNYFIPAGAMAHLHIFDVHRDPNFWPDPLRFDPDRFLPENAQSRHPFSYVPFSGGPRNCIGQKFGMMELKSMIGHLIHNFYLESMDLAKDIEIMPDLVLRPKNTTRVKFIPR